MIKRKTEFCRVPVGCDFEFGDQTYTKVSSSGADSGGVFYSFGEEIFVHMIYKGAFE